MTTAAKGRGEGQDSSTSTGAGGAGLLQGWPQCGELNGGGGHSQLQSSNPESSSGESAMCGALGFVCVHPFAGQSKGFLPKKTCFRAGQSLSSLSITHHHGKRALQPTCLSHNNEAKRALQPTCPARDWRSVAICHTGFNTVHTCTMGHGNVKTLGFPNNNGHRKFLLVSNTTLQRPYLGTHIFPAQAA